jgi:4-amino-4-deoxy-L-arabinose transferase-like glycosyltransferase
VIAADRPAWRPIAAAVLAGLVLRLAFGLGYWVGKPMTHDEHEYLALAGSLAAGRGFTYGPEHESGTAQQFGRAPIYPLFLAAIGATQPDDGNAPARVKIVQSVLGTALVLVIGALAARAAGRRAGTVAAWIAACYPPLVWFPAYVLSETLYSLLALTGALLLQIAVTRSRRAHSPREGGPLALFAGALVGVAVLTRPAMLVFVPMALLWLVRAQRHVLAVAFLAAAVAVIAPWTARNYRAYGRFVLVASEGGVTFWTGNHPLARGEGDLAANPEIKRAELDFRRAHEGVSAEALEPLYYQDALRHIQANPAWWLGLLAKKAFYTVVPTGPSYAVHSARYRIASIASYLLLLPFALYGFGVLRRAAEPPVALGLLVLSSVLVCLIFFPQERFRVPVLDPALIVATAAGIRRISL